MNRRKATEDPQSALLGDLESIRTLLEDDDDDAPTLPEPASDDIEVPVLEDIVDTDINNTVGGGSSVPESVNCGAGDWVPESGSATDSPPPTGVSAGSATESPPATVGRPGLGDDLFRALLSDEWRASANEILEQARHVIGEHRADWTPAETDSLNDALKVRIDATIQGWMRGMVVKHMADLHELLLRELADELRSAIDDIIEQRSEKTDGE